MVFPQTQIVPIVELALGADLTADPGTWAWTDISSYVRVDGGISITMGRSDENSSASPADLRIKVDNRDGRFVRLNPTSPYYGRLNRNTPIRVTVETEPGVQYQRFGGFISELPSSWKAKGNDSWVELQANGVLRRLEQADAARSPLRNSILELSPVAYWPLEDQPGSTVGASAIAGVADMTQVAVESVGPISTQIEFGAIEGPAGSFPGPKAPLGYVGLNAATPSMTGNAWSVACIVYAAKSSDVSANLDPLAVNVEEEGTSSITRFHFEIDEASTTWQAYNESFTSIDLSSTPRTAPNMPMDGNWHLAIITMEQVGSDIDLHVYWDDDDHDTLFTAQTLTAPVGIMAPWYGVYHDDIEDRSTAHVALWDRALSSAEASSLWAAFNGHLLERAVDRMTRVCAQEAVGFSVVEGAEPSEPVGPQPLDKLSNILRDCESVDGGALHETTDFDLGYIARSQFRDKSVDPLGVDISLTELQFDPAFQHQDDDQDIGNDWTITREGGVSARLSDEDHVVLNGRYDRSETVNLASDDRPLDYAGWYLRKGTTDAYRYPGIDLDLARDPSLIPAWTSAGIGGRILITDPPPGLPPEDIDLFVEGYTENIGPYSWKVSVNASPVAPWRTATLDSETYGRLDTDGSTLVAAVDSDDTTLRVVSSDGPEWITTADYASEFPFDVTLAGEQMTVSAISSGMRDTFTRVSASGWGSSDTGHVWTSHDGSATDYQVSGTKGQHIHTVRNVRHFTTMDYALTNADVTSDVTLGILPTVGSISAGVMARFTDTNNYYMIHFPFAIDGTLNLQLYKRVAGAFTLLAEKRNAVTYVVGAPVRARLQVRGQFLKAKVWNVADPEPYSWDTGAYDTSLSSGYVGLQSIVMSNNTNTLPITVEFDDLSVANVQDFTVTRSVNTVVKPHLAGAAVSLTQPAVLAV